MWWRSRTHTHGYPQVVRGNRFDRFCCHFLSVDGPSLQSGQRLSRTRVLEDSSLVSTISFTPIPYFCCHFPIWSWSRFTVTSSLRSVQCTQRPRLLGQCLASNPASRICQFYAFIFISNEWISDRSPTCQGWQPTSTTPLRSCSRSLPELPRQLLPLAKVGNLVYIAGHIATLNNKPSLDISSTWKPGILAADESTGTMGKRLANCGLENTEENRWVVKTKLRSRSVYIHK